MSAVDIELVYKPIIRIAFYQNMMLFSFKIQPLNLENIFGNSSFGIDVL